MLGWIGLALMLFGIALLLAFWTVVAVVHDACQAWIHRFLDRRKTLALAMLFAPLVGTALVLYSGAREGGMSEQIHVLDTLLPILWLFLPPLLFYNTVYRVDPSDTGRRAVLLRGTSVSFPSPGIHFCIPLVERVEYVSLEPTVEPLAFSVMLEGDKELVAKAVATYGLPAPDGMDPRRFWATKLSHDKIRGCALDCTYDSCLPVLQKLDPNDSQALLQLYNTLRRSLASLLEQSGCVLHDFEVNRLETGIRTFTPLS